MDKRKITKKRYNKILKIFIMQKKISETYFEIFGVECPFVFTRDGRRI